jgi:hypothetical protein
LLLRGEEPNRRAPSERLVREYGEWAGALAAAGALVAAGELRVEGARWVTPVGWNDADPTAEPLGGFFVVRASDADAAAELALGSPHLGYGGVIEVIPIESNR